MYKLYFFLSYISTTPYLGRTLTKFTLLPIRQDGLLKSRHSNWDFCQSTSCDIYIYFTHNKTSSAYTQAKICSAGVPSDQVANCLHMYSFLNHSHTIISAKGSQRLFIWQLLYFTCRFQRITQLQHQQLFSVSVLSFVVIASDGTVQHMWRDVCCQGNCAGS